MKTHVKKIISVVITTLLISNFVFLPISATSKSATSAYSSSPITIDGAIGENEIWSSISDENKIYLNGWKESKDNVSQTQVSSDNVPILKIANTSDYLYLYLETNHFTNSDNNSGKRAWIQIAFSEDETFYSDTIWTDKETFRSYDGGYAFINLNVADNPDTTDINERAPYNGGVMEAKISLPFSVKKAMTQNDVDITLSLFLQNGMTADGVDGNSQNGFTTVGGYRSGDYTKGEKVTLKKINSVWPLSEYLHNIDLVANEMLEIIIPNLATKEGIDENLKAHDMLRWVAEMNNIKASAEEIVLQEVIYV